MDKFLQRMLANVSDSSLGRGVMDYLAARRATPEIKTGYLGEGTSGEFTTNSFFGNELPRNGQVTVSSGYENYERKPSSDATATLAHELTHAGTRQLTIQSSETPYRDRGENQFNQAYSKLMYGPYTPKGQESFGPAELTRRLAPGWLKEKRDYRASNEELPAFAIGNMVNPDPARQAGPPHVDASLAQEQAVLQEIALRDILSKKPKGR